MIDSQEELDRLVEQLAREPEIAVDCEMDSMYAYGTSLCVVQVGWPGHEALIDGLAELDRSALGSLFRDPAIVTVFHGGENDIGLMRDRWGFDFAATFDTMAASQVLGHEGVGLAAVLERHFDVKLSKKYQKADWRVRPLPDEQAEYARMDVRYLIPLRRNLLADLERLERVEEAESEFTRIARACIEEKPFEPDNWARVKGSRDLKPGLRSVVRALFVARDELARRFDRAPYRVLHDSAIVALARQQPRSQDAYMRVRGVNRSLPAADIRRLLDAIVKGLDEGEIPLPKLGNRRRPWEPSADARLTPEQTAVLDALRKWRVQRAKKRGVEVARVATTALLAAIARAGPSSTDQLEAVEGVEPWRVREYGEDILGVIARANGRRKQP